ncbi:MAG: transporter related [Firmicutes bacterium]|nr:transporter related [Bacillota bacterium]
MIKVENLSYSFAQKDLYQNISFTLEDGQHCAFIGTSGSGKSTLIDILMDPDRYMFDGTLEIMPNCRIGYVSQFSRLDNTQNITVFEYIAEEFLRLQDEIATLCTEMETAAELEPLLERYQFVSDAFGAIGGDSYESNITKKLNLANLKGYEDRQVAKLSGGEFKLIQVIKEMLTGPDLIIMDEPDAFLDFENLNSLKKLINSHKGTMLIVTHSRYLLNHCFNKILHLENKELQEFEGSYIDYNFALLQSKIELQELALNDTLEIERNEVLIDQLRSVATYVTEASRGKSLNARVKILERLEARRIKAPFLELKQPAIHFVSNHEIEDTEVVKVNHYSMAFDEMLLNDVSFEIRSTDKVALIGSNGTGKTTLLRDIYKNTQDTIWVKEDVKMSYLSQLQGEMLKESNTVAEEFLDFGFKTYDQVLSHIMDYGFAEEVLHQKISSLSGGEKNILQLAKVAANDTNLLLLDEPISHLDTNSQLALEKAIKEYNGAVLMISHDFYSIVNCMDYVLMIEDKSVRKMSLRKFRKMIYDKHFNKDYLATEEKKKEVETKITTALKGNDFSLAKALSEELEALIKLL